MRTYSWIDRRLPGVSFVNKITLAGLLIVHIPLLAVIGIALLDPGLSVVTICLIALAATLLATLAMTAVLRGLLAPLQLAGTLLADYLTHRRLPPQVRDGGDDAGRLLHDVAISCARIEQQRIVLERHALQDPLTGINNRRGAQALLEKATPDQSHPLSLGLVDVDNLRQLNAGGGHAHGDRGLQRVARELTAVLRGADWAARWGGDEFLVVCQCAGPEMVTVMDRVRRALAAAHAGDGQVDVSVSIGVAELRQAEPLEACIARADAALYTAKNRGKGSVHAA